MLTPAAVSAAGTVPPPSSSIGHRLGRQGPSARTAAPDTHWLSGAMATGRTTTPLSRTWFSSATWVGDPSPRPLTSPVA